MDTVKRPTRRGPRGVIHNECFPFNIAEEPSAVGPPEEAQRR